MRIPRACLTARALVAAAVVLSAAACGGGGGSPGNEDTLGTPNASADSRTPSTPSTPASTTSTGTGTTGTTATATGTRRTSEPGAPTATAPASPVQSPTDGPADKAETPTSVAATGVVRNASGAPVAGVTVSASSLDSPNKGVPELAVMSNSAGRYSWPAVLAPGTYELRAETPDGPSVASVEIRTGATTTADLYFRPDD